jgi:hypothetical protein
MWHCPHCGAPQAETARCWVCRRSSTTCSTCRHFRRALSSDLGYCALDRRRQPLTGRELRGCWEESPAESDAAPSIAGAGPGGVAGRAAPQPVPIAVQRLRREGRVRHTNAAWADEAARTARTFVPVDDLEPPAGPPWPSHEEPVAPPPFIVGEPQPDWTERTDLFGDPET